MSGLVDIGDEEFIPFLNNLGVDTYKKSFEWMLNDPDFSGVLRWIYNSIDESNALSSREECRFAEIEKRGSVLLQEDLENSIVALQQDFPGICIAGDKTSIEDVKLDIKGQTERLAMLERHEQCLRDVIKQNELANEELNVEVTKLNAALQQSTVEETAAKEECISLAQEVESMTNQVTDEVAHILSMYERCKSDKEIAKRFFAFGPFDAYRQSQEVFKCNFDLYSSKMYYNTQCEQVSHNNLQTAFVKAQALEERFSETVEAYIDTKANLCGEQAKLSLIRNFTSLHPSQVGVAILEAKSKLDLLERESSHIEDEVLNGAVREYVERRTRYALDVTTRTSLAVREQVLRDLRFLVGGTRQALAVDRVLYSALRCELGAAEMLLHFADQLRDYLCKDAAELRCRMKSMSDICLEQSTCEQSTDIIVPALRLWGATDGSGAMRIYNELCSERQELMDSIRDGIRSKEDSLEEFKNMTKLLMEYIYDGCTRRPNGRERGAAVAHELRHALDQVDAKVLQTSGMFNTVKNGDQQGLRKLWQWFLADAARLLATIRHVQKR